jgi:hypothetical protein
MKKHSAFFSLFFLSIFAEGQYDLVWQNSQPNSKSITASTADAADNIIIAGTFTNTISFSAHTLTHSGVTATTSYIAKMNADGSWAWASKINITAANHQGIARADIYDITTDNSGNVYITGRFQGTISFDNISLTELVSTKRTVFTVYTSDIFVAKMNSAGTFLWAKREGNVYEDACRGICLDPGGNVYIAGVSQKNSTPNFDPELYVAKYNNAGTKQWEKKFGVTSNTPAFGASDIAIDGINNIYVTGVYRGTAKFSNNITVTSATLCTFLAKLNSTTGAAIWARSATGNENDGKSLLVDNANNVYVAGKYRFAAVSFGSFSLPAPTWIHFSDSHNTFLAKYSSSGNPLWATQTINTDHSTFFGGLNMLFAYPGGKIGIYTEAENGLHIKGFDPLTGAQTDATQSTGFTWQMYFDNISVASARSVTATSDGFVFSVSGIGSFGFDNLTLTSAQTLDIDLPRDLFLAKYTAGPAPVTQKKIVAAEEKTIAVCELYPNPASNQVTLRNKNNNHLGNVTIYDGSGKILYRNLIGTSQAIIDLKNFSAGIYYLRTDQQNTVIKFAKQ